ncbi:hypothetical protein [Paenibacillus agricola]|uniref:Uncharacterized protein n=1 Tax=Paenibacillus agricola TaxID=2716264 RepID=A0ABX0JBM6_9BACL|nr:hypothetical protein [Paenibacillus agricola]NHN33353.1 hypothetical protein [Paenibacillus agricola]
MYFWENPFDTILWASFLLIIAAGISVILSIGKGQRILAVNEMRIYVQLETTERLSRWQKIYVNEDENQLIQSMGIPFDAAKLKVFRDIVTLVVFVTMLLRWSDYQGNLFLPIASLFLLYSTMWPSVKNFTIFSNVIGPVLQKVRRYRVTRETHVLLLLLRNEVQEIQQRNVLYLIQKYQDYFKIIKGDLILLEHEWGRGKEVALMRLQQRHPGNEEIAYLASMLRDLDGVEYNELDKMLKENSDTLNKKQQSSFEARENDLNQVLFMINVAGTGLAMVWFVIGLFLWSYSFDTNY